MLYAIYTVYARNVRILRKTRTLYIGGFLRSIVVCILKTLVLP